MHKDPERKDLYIKRHEKREEQLWRHIRANLRTAAYWSRWLTWEFSSISDAIKFIQQKQDVKINSRIWFILFIFFHLSNGLPYLLQAPTKHTKNFYLRTRLSFHLPVLSSRDYAALKRRLRICEVPYLPHWVQAITDPNKAYHSIPIPINHPL